MEIPKPNKILLRFKSLKLFLGLILFFLTSIYTAYYGIFEYEKKEHIEVKIIDSKSHFYEYGESVYVFNFTDRTSIKNISPLTYDRYDKGDEYKIIEERIDLFKAISILFISLNIVIIILPH
jgi:hypothetical protein